MDQGHRAGKRPASQFTSELGMTIESYIRDLKTNKPVLAAVIGNSIGCGYWSTGAPSLPSLCDVNGQLLSANRSTDAVTGSWVKLLRADMKVRNPASDLLNFSGNGWNSNDHRGIKTAASPIPSPTDTVEKILALPVRPSVVYLPLQINDEPLGLSVFEANTRAIISALAAGGVATVLVKENYISGSSAHAQFVQKTGDIAASLGIPCIDTYTPFLPTGDGLLYDTKHPNDKGQMLIYVAHRAWIDNYKIDGLNPFLVGRSDVAFKLSDTGALRFRDGEVTRAIAVRFGVQGTVNLKVGDLICGLVSE